MYSLTAGCLAHEIAYRPADSDAGDTASVRGPWLSPESGCRAPRNKWLTCEAITLANIFFEPGTLARLPRFSCLENILGDGNGLDTP
jgi:hypothetical protein